MRVGPLFVSDLDGTLVGKTGRLGDYSKRKLTELLLSGLNFTVASARNAASLAPILEGLPLTLPVIELNGALVTDLATGRSLFCEPLAANIVDHVLQLAADQRLKVCVSTDEGSPDNPVVRLALSAPKPALQRIQRSIESVFPERANTVLYPSFNPNRALPCQYTLTVQSARADKARAIEWLCRRLGCTWQDVTVFGDELNDLSMFRKAGRAVAVDNAVPALKAQAHTVIGACETGSVIRYLSDAQAKARASLAELRPTV